jgi:hypothetical protein
LGSITGPGEYVTQVKTFENVPSCSFSLSEQRRYKLIIYFAQHVIL